MQCAKTKLKGHTRHQFLIVHPHVDTLFPQKLCYTPHDRFVPAAVAHEYVFWGGCVGQGIFPLGRITELELGKVDRLWLYQQER
jgi:hypothetical protein